MTFKCFRNSVQILLLAHFFQYTALAGQQREMTIEWIYSDDGTRPSTIPRYVWLESGDALIYDTRRPIDERTLERLDPRTGRRSNAVIQDRAMESLRSLLPDDEAITWLSWPAGFNRDGRHSLYLFDGDLFLLDLASSTFQRVTNTPGEEKSVRFSPDGNKIAFVRDNDLFVYDILDEEEKRLTEDGSKTTLNGTLSWVYWEEIFGRHDIGYWWSEDSSAIAFLRTDESPVSVMHYKDFSPTVPRLIQQRYPKAGETNPLVRLGVFDLETNRTSWLDSSEIPYEYLLRVKWLPDSRRVSFQTLNRMQNRLDLYLMDRGSGETAHILTETDPAWVNVHDDLHFLSNGNQFIWASERDGHAHLYRYTMKGELVNQITRGEWSIRASGGVYWVRQGVAAIDETEGWIYFTALEKSSIERHLYRIRFDGTGMERISSEDGTHRVAFSPDASYYFDDYSTSSTPPSLSLRDNRGRVSLLVAPAQTELLTAFNMQYPEILSIPASDGFLLPVQISKPADFDPSHKYPVILHVYGGPAAPTVSDAWSSRSYFDQVLLDNGYLVVRVDNRTATARSKKLENLVLENLMSDGELSDLVDAVSWLKSQSYVDPDRIGIWGWSGGGTFTLLAMTGSQEFKAGIAVAPVTDFHYYDTKWAEAYMKTPQSNPEGYERTSLVRRAKNLHGRLLLVHGTFDDNVHPQNSWHFIDELIRAGKPVDMMMYPKRKHGISDRPARIHLYKKMLEFWKSHL